MRPASDCMSPASEHSLGACQWAERAGVKGELKVLDSRAECDGPASERGLDVHSSCGVHGRLVGRWQTRCLEQESFQDCVPILLA